MDALVTGGGGFLGGRLVDMLRAQGHRVRVLGRRHYPNLDQAGVEPRTGDIRDPDAVQAACMGMDTVFHVAGRAGVWGPARDFFATNLTGTENVIEACLRQGVSRLVYTSSPSVVCGEQSIENGDESLPYPTRYLAAYPAAKAAAERAVLAANRRSWQGDSCAAGGHRPHSAGGVLLTCAIRPHLIWGPGDPHLVPRLLAAARRRRLVRVGDGTNRVDLTFVDHAARAHLLAAARLGPDSPVAGQAYFVGDREPVVLWDWINALLCRAGIAPVRRALSYRAARRLGAALEWLYRACPWLGEPPMTRFVAAQLAHSHYFSHEKARRELGYEPHVPPEEAMTRLFEWLTAAAVPH